MPRPELTSRPQTKAPNERFPPTNNSVSRSDDAQLGIKPIIEVNKGAKQRLADIKLEKLSSPIKPINVPNARLIINI